MLLEIEGLTKRYRRAAKPALDGVDLALDGGQVYGLLGHNGAGKTTLVNDVVGLLRPDAGTVRIAGHDAVADPGFARRACSLQPQAQVPIRGLTPRQAVELLGELRGACRRDVRARFADLARSLDLGEWLDTDGAHLSGGVRRLVSFCMAAVAPGRLVVLDEPTNDVDPVRRRLLWGQVRELAEQGTGVLLVTHNILEAERSVDRLAILDHGRVIAEGRPADLKASVADEFRLELVVEPGQPELAFPSFLRHVTRAGDRVVATLPAAFAGRGAAWADELRRQARIEEFSVGPSTLEDAYIALIEQSVPSARTAIGTLGQEVRDVRAA